jgi:hypothetical protein
VRPFRLVLSLVVVSFGLFASQASAVSRGWSSTLASAYSAAATGSTRQGCPGAPPLRDTALSVATFLVPCGTRLRICYQRRCATATRWDSGPYAPGRGFDLNLGVVRALGYPSCRTWGVRAVRWRRL